MSDANYKNRLRKRLDNHSTPMNLESEWAALEARRPTKKKKPFIWFWFGSVAVMMAFLVWYNIDQTSNSSADITKNESVNIDQQLSMASHPTIELTTNMELTTVNEQQSISTTKTFSNISKNSKAIPQNFQPELDDDKVKIIDLVKKEAITDTSKKVTNSTSINKNQTSLGESKNTFTQITQIPNKKITLLSISSPIPILNFLTSEREEITKQKEPIWALGIEATYGKSFRQLDALNPSTQLLIDRRNKFETPLDSWNVSLNLSRMINQNWFTEIGFGYSQTTDRFQDIYVTNNSQPTADQVISIIYRRDGTTDIISGEVIAEETTTTIATYYHYHKNVFAQIIFGRKFSFNNHWGSSFSSGLNYSLLTLKNGTIFSNDSSNTYDDLSKSNYRKTGLTNLLIQTEIYYLMNKNWEASFGFQVSGSVNNSFQNTSGFSDKRKVGSLLIGLKKWF
ncbi:MAG: hypothetical protein AB8H03_13020 [Saprospiraceae bacterium]